MPNNQSSSFLAEVLRYSSYTPKYEIHTQDQMDEALNFHASRVFFWGKTLNLQKNEKMALHERITEDSGFQKEGEIHLVNLINLIGTSDPMKVTFMVQIDTYKNKVQIDSEKLRYENVSIPNVQTIRIIAAVKSLFSGLLKNPMK